MWWTTLLLYVPAITWSNLPHKVKRITRDSRLTEQNKPVHVLCATSKAARRFAPAATSQLSHTSRYELNQPVTISVHGSLHAVFRVGKPQYDLLRFDFQVGLWRDRRLPDRQQRRRRRSRRRRRRRLLLLPVLREPAPGEQPDGAERGAGGVQLPLRRPELRQLFPLQHRPIRHLLLSGGRTLPRLLRKLGGDRGGGGGSLWLIDQSGSVDQFISLQTH